MPPRSFLEPMAVLRTSSSLHSGKSFCEERATVSQLSDDLIEEIILKLPIKSVARSQCVAKTWRATISDDYLRRRLPLQMSVLYFPDGDPAAAGGGKGPRFACAPGGDGRLEDCDLSFFPFREGAMVCDACNGLLLFRSAGTAARFYVVDPVTLRWAALPRPSKDAMLSVLAFDPSSSRGFHVLNFTGWRDRGAALEVFSSEAWAWSVRDAEFGVAPDSLLCGSMHFHDGAVYLLASDEARAVRVDVAGELACTAVDLPEPVDRGDARVEHSGGRMHYVTSEGELLKFWVLDDDDQWRLKHVVKIDDVLEGGFRGREVRFLCLHPEKDAVYVWSPWKLVEYDLTRKEITESWEFGGKGGGKDEKNRIVRTWLVPSSFYLTDCLADRSAQC